MKTESIASSAATTRFGLSSGELQSNALAKLITAMMGGVNPPARNIDVPTPRLTDPTTIEQIETEKNNPLLPSYTNDTNVDKGNRIRAAIEKVASGPDEMDDLINSFQKKPAPTPEEINLALGNALLKADTSYFDEDDIIASKLILHVPTKSISFFGARSTPYDFHNLDGKTISDQQLKELRLDVKRVGEVSADAIYAAMKKDAGSVLKREELPEHLRPALNLDGTIDSERLGSIILAARMEADTTPGPRLPQNFFNAESMDQLLLLGEKVEGSDRSYTEVTVTASRIHSALFVHLERPLVRSQFAIDPAFWVEGHNTPATLERNK